MQSKTLVIKGKGGLGNRILSAISGLVYADLSGRKPVIDWRDGSYAPLGENAYPLLFQSPIGDEAIGGATMDDGADVCPAIWAGNLHRQPQDMIDTYMPRSHSNPWGYRRLCVDLKRLDQSQAVAVYWSYLPKLGRMRQHLRRDARFAKRGEREVFADYLGRYFTPNARVRHALSQMRPTAKLPSIGVHIRFTDRKIPLGPVLKTLEQLKARHPTATIFLATDNAEIEDRLKRAFDKVITHPKRLGLAGARLHGPDTTCNPLQEAENALIDMWQLSRCDHLIYSRRSTFSVTSGYLGRFAPARIHDVERYSPTLWAKELLQRYA